MAELENSKAKLVAAIATQLKTMYEKQVTYLQQKVTSWQELEGKNRQLHERELGGQREQVASLQSQRAEKEGLVAQVSRLEERARATRKMNRVLWLILVALGLIVGIIVWRKV